MPSENTRRDRALEDIVRQLSEVNRHLRRIAENGRSVKFTNHPVDGPPDPFDPELSQQELPAPEPEAVHPYLRRSVPTEGTNAVE